MPTVTGIKGGPVPAAGVPDLPKILRGLLNGVYVCMYRYIILHITVYWYVILLQVVWAFNISLLLVLLVNKFLYLFIY